MKRETASLVHALTWLTAFWNRKQAPELIRQYHVMKATCPLVVADLARMCSAFDDTFDETSARASDRNQGKRAVWLHLEALMNITPDDLNIIRSQTENDDDAPS